MPLEGHRPPLWTVTMMVAELSMSPTIWSDSASKLPIDSVTTVSPNTELRDRDMDTLSTVVLLARWLGVLFRGPSRTTRYKSWCADVGARGVDVISTISTTSGKAMVEGAWCAHASIGSGQVDGMAFEISQRTGCQRSFVRGAQDDARGLAGFKGLLPARRTEAPSITWFEAGILPRPRSGRQSSTTPARRDYAKLLPLPRQFQVPEGYACQ
jgi:hypothetical protein